MRCEPAPMEPQWRFAATPALESCRPGWHSLVRVQCGLTPEFAQIVEAVKMTCEGIDRNSPQHVNRHRPLGIGKTRDLRNRRAGCEPRRSMTSSASS